MERRLRGIHIALAAAVLTSLGSYPSAAACLSNTGSNATVILPDTVDAPSFETGDHLTVHASEGQCVGELIWQGTEAQAFTIWGDDPITPEADGLRPYEPLQFRLRKAADTTSMPVHVELSEGPPPYRAEATYVPDAVYLVKALTPTSDAAHVGQPVMSLSDAASLSGDYAFTLTSSEPDVELTLALATPQHVRVDVYLTDGTSLMTLFDDHLDAATPHHFHLETSSLPPGRYVILAKGEDFQHIQHIGLDGE